MSGRIRHIGHIRHVRHIGLATVTYLYDGAMMHRDSLGTEHRIEPGAINWMSAGRYFSVIPGLTRDPCAECKYGRSKRK